MEATFENEKFGKEKWELFVFVVVFVVFETEKYERCEFQYEVGKKKKLPSRGCHQCIFIIRKWKA
jgi:hypothetical protein